MPNVIDFKKAKENLMEKSKRKHEKRSTCILVKILKTSVEGKIHEILEVLLEAIEEH
jgi:hypothetical protein